MNVYSFIVRRGYKFDMFDLEFESDKAAISYGDSLLTLFKIMRHSGHGSKTVVHNF